MFDYLSAPKLPSSQESTVVFGRQDKLVAHAAGELALAGQVGRMIITGGIGKDSGDLKAQGFNSEAAYLHEELKRHAAEHGYSLPVVALDPHATNGGENARNSLALLTDASAPINTLTAVSHATSARRLAETLRFEAINLTGASHEVFIKPSAHAFNAENPTDQVEARAEILRLADWPKKDLLLPQEDLPDELVEFARDEQNK